MNTRQISPAIIIKCDFFLSSTDGYDKDPCSNYRTLRGTDRAAGFNKLTKKSDKRKAWKEDWYRFTGDAGNKMAIMQVLSFVINQYCEFIFSDAV